jgi:hypothetical protein
MKPAYEHNLDSELTSDLISHMQTALFEPVITMES